MENLSGQIEEVAAKLLPFLQHNTLKNICHENEQETIPKKGCYIHKHSRKTGSRDESEQSLRYDVIRMLIKGSESPHALCLHVCNGSTDFHVYSKKGWVSFCPNQDSLVITLGDKLQVNNFFFLTGVINIISLFPNQDYLVNLYYIDKYFVNFKFILNSNECDK